MERLGPSLHDLGIGGDDVPRAGWSGRSRTHGSSSRTPVRSASVESTSALVATR
jgi:hypothetical protein